MNKEEQLTEFIKLYDRFIDHYNGVKNKITATSELIIIHDELEKRMVNSRFVKITKEGEIKDFTPDNEMRYWMESIDMNKYFPSLKKINYADLINHIENNDTSKDEHDEWLEYLEKQVHMRKKIHLDAIHSVTEKIISNQYPKRSLSKFNDLESKEKEELSGAVLDKKIEKEVRQAEHWANIVKAVYDVVGDKPLSQFVTKNGNANTALYTNVFNKYKKVKRGTLRDWLDEALKSDKLRQDLLKMKKQQNI